MEAAALSRLMKESGALKEGHFLRASGRHSDHYVQIARLFEDPQQGETLGRALAAELAPLRGQAVMAAALGGILIGYEVARALRLPFLYSERRDGAMTLRRGFSIAPGTRVLLIEDEVQTGTSVREMQEIVRALKSEVAGIGCIVDKSGGRLRMESPFVSLLSVSVTHYPQKACPLCAQGIPAQDSP